MSVAKISGLCYGAIGLLFAPILLIAGILGVLGSSVSGDSSVSGIGAISLAVLLPVGYAVMGFVMGAMGAFIYNLISGWIGGIEVELEVITAAQVSLIQQPNP